VEKRGDRVYLRLHDHAPSMFRLGRRCWWVQRSQTSGLGVYHCRRIVISKIIHNISSIYKVTVGAATYDQMNTGIHTIATHPLLRPSRMLSWNTCHGGVVSQVDRCCSLHAQAVNHSWIPRLVEVFTSQQASQWIEILIFKSQIKQNFSSTN